MLPQPPYNIELSPKAERDLIALERVGDWVLDGLERFAETGTPCLKRLAGDYKRLWRLRFGDYRAIVEFDKRYDKNKTIIVLAVGHRSEVYKR